MRFPTVAAIAMLLAGAAQADPYEGVPNPHYPDGTGNDQVDRLNAGQLNPPPPPPDDGPTSYPPPQMPPGSYGAPPPPYYGPTSYPPPPRPYEPPPQMPPGAYGAPPPPPND